MMRQKQKCFFKVETKTSEEKEKSGTTTRIYRLKQTCRTKYRNRYVMHKQNKHIKQNRHVQTKQTYTNKTDTYKQNRHIQTKQTRTNKTDVYGHKQALQTFTDKIANIDKANMTSS